MQSKVPTVGTDQDRGRTIAELERELSDAHRREAATADVLKVISRSAFDLQKVLDTLIESAARLCDADSGIIFRPRGLTYRHAASYGLTPTFKQHAERVELEPGGRSVVGRALTTRRTAHVPDVALDPEYAALDPERFGGYRAFLGVPLLRDGIPIGVIMVGSRRPREHTEKQIELLETFAGQAVIAIENTRLFEVEQARTRELSEALEQQTATAEILKVISNSPTDTRPVFEAIVKTGLDLFGGMTVALLLVAGDKIVRSAHALAPEIGVDPAEDVFPLPLDETSFSGRAVLRREVVHVPDIAEFSSSMSRTIAERMGFRACVFAPMVREGKGIGAIGVVKAEKGPFTDKKIELLETFADQAVIAIENARLFKETKEALERQTATAEVLKVIASSQADVQPVLDAIAAAGCRLLGGHTSILRLLDGDAMRFAAMFSSTSTSPEVAKRIRQPLMVGADAVPSELVTKRKPVIIADTETDHRISSSNRDIARGRGYRSFLAVPLLRGEAVFGALNVSRREPGTFAEHEINLLQTFADQAVIAIENTRLFEAEQARTKELTESLEQQTATSEVLRVISSAQGKLEPVFDAMLENATRICEANFGILYLYEEEKFGAVAMLGVPPAFAEWLLREPRYWDPTTGLGRLVQTKQAVHIPDVRAEDLYTEGHPQRVAFVEMTGVRSFVAVPILKDDELIGSICIFRQEFRPFMARQIELVANFADQAVIAIENVRLFEAEQARTAELTEALEQQTATAEILSVISSSLSDTQPVFDAIVQSGLKLFPGALVSVALRYGDTINAAAVAAPDPARVEAWRRTISRTPLARNYMHGAALLDRRIVDLPDVADAPAEFLAGGQNFLTSGNRAITIMPMMRGDEAIGLLSVVRLVPGPLSDKQIAVLKTFASQAVIAIENTRLLNELRESLEQQTATAEVLGAISRSKFELQPVLDTLVTSAAHLCEAPMVAVHVQSDAGLPGRARHGFPADMVEALGKVGQVMGRGSLAGRTLAEGRPVHIPDVEADAEYAFRDFTRITGACSMLGVPLLRDGKPVGLLSLYRTRVAPFTSRQVELIATFADQAVIAIENTRLFEELQEKNHALSEAHAQVSGALQRETATSQILRVIGSSPTNVQPVFDTIARSGVSVCGALGCVVLVVEDGMIRVAATHGVRSERLDRFHRDYPIPLSADTDTARTIRERRIFHLADIESNPNATASDIEHARLASYRTRLMVPMVRGDRTLGLIAVTREDPTPFPDQLVELLKTFADQAVIAIENTRLFEEVQARTHELTESLEYQTATSDVLNVISRSPSNLQPVLDAIVETAAQLCHADNAHVFRPKQGKYHLVAYNRSRSDFIDYLSKNPIDPGQPGSVTGRAVAEQRTVHIPDNLADPEHRSGIFAVSENRSVLSVPLLRNGEPVGAITVGRRRVAPFSNKEIELITTFADQAVIAIENTRLFEEVQARTRELSESLEYQTATSDVLNVISRSKFDLQPVLDTIVETAARLCDGDMCDMRRREGDAYIHVASYGTSSDYGDHQRSIALVAGRESITGRVLLEGRAIQIPDVLADPEYALTETQRLGGYRTILGVPLLREGVQIGIIVLMRRRVQPFTDKQIELVTTFANQAVIAIENTRLFEEVQARTRELQESLEYQTATSEVLSVISRSKFNLQPVLDSIARVASNLCAADDVTILTRDNNELQMVAHLGAVPIQLGLRRPISRDWVSGRAVFDQRPVHVSDLAAAGDEYPLGREIAKRFGHRTTLAVPLMRQGEAIGCLLLRRLHVQDFEEKQIDLLKTFADQAVIAIENTRLFEEVQARTNELQEALEQQTATSGVLQVISRSPTDIAPVLNVVVESAMRICDAYDAVILLKDGDTLRTSAHFGPIPIDFIALPLGRDWVAGRAVVESKVMHVPDLDATGSEFPLTRENAAREGFRALVAAPLLRRGTAIGTIVIRRREARPFSDKQIALLQTFADQAVIAIDNARLFEEVQARTRELGRSVEELRSLGEVSQTVNSSLALEKVLPAILEHACAISYASGGAIYEFHKASGEFQLAAGHKMTDEHIARVREQPSRLGDPVVGECGDRREAVQIADLRGAPSSPLLDILLRTGVRAILAVPLMHQGEVIGALVVRRNHPGAFSAEIIHLLEAFAAQSAIAVHNARLFAEIAQKGRELEIASQHKSQFVANMSHELRTPLAAILGYAELMQEGFYEPPGQKSMDALSRIRSNGKHLLGLINTVLDIAKIEAGQFSLSLAEYALDGVVETVRVATESLAETKKLSLRTEVAKPLPVGLGDEQRLTQVLLNLVGNAIKFTDAGEVRITATAMNGHFTVAVTDTGPGIPPQELKRVFEQFHQIDNSNTKAKGGTGLGLAIARQIVEMHGGRIWVESTLGKGATFHMELPVRAGSGKGAA